MIMSIKNGILSSMCLASGGIVLIAVLGFALRLVGEDSEGFVPGITVISTVGLACLVGIIIYWLGKLEISKFIIDEVQLGATVSYSKMMGYVAGGLVLSIFVSTAMVWSASQLGAEFLIPTVEYSNVIFDGPLILLSIISLAIVVPISEEIFFRSYLSKNFYELGITSRIVLTAAIFALFHAGQLEVIVIASTFVTGTILGYVYHKFNSVTPCILIHAGQNLLVICITVILN